MIKEEKNLGFNNAYNFDQWLNNDLPDYGILEKERTDLSLFYNRIFSCSFILETGEQAILCKHLGTRYDLIRAGRKRFFIMQIWDMNRPNWNVKDYAFRNDVV